jgi:hypothetical protein
MWLGGGLGPGTRESSQHERRRDAGDSALGLDPDISISNRLMITTYCLWFAVAASGPAQRPS